MGNRLKDLRNARNWTLDDAAKHFDMSRSGYIKIERGERKLDDARIEKAKAIYGVSAAEILGEDFEIDDEGRRRLIEAYDLLSEDAQSVALRQIEDLARLYGKAPAAGNAKAKP